MIDSIINGFDIWTDAQGVKSKGRVKSIENINFEGIVRLRELILDLAIRGKLVPQDLNDEPASVLLEKMAFEKAELVKKGEIKKRKLLPQIKEEEISFDLPIKWQYARLNDIGEWGAGSTPLRGNSEYYGGEIPWFKSGELRSDYISSSEETVTELALKKTSLRYNNIGDVLIAMYGATIGKTSILKVRGSTNQAVCACTPFTGVYNVFLLTLLKAYRKRFILQGAGGAQPNISREKIISTVFALPPLEEQKRIVAKVDELMTLCDKLEKQQISNLKTHQLLVKTLLSALTQAADADDFQMAWERLCDCFDILFCTEDSIEQLKKTILQLAVMGKLVKQNPQDEPANILLEKIVLEKARLAKEGLIKKQKSLSVISNEEHLFSLPIGWNWVRLGEVGVASTGKTPKTSISEFFGGSIPFVGPGQINIDGTMIAPDKFLTEKGSKHSTIAQIGDILMVCIGGSIGKHAIVKCTLSFNQQLNSIKPIFIDSSYLFIAMSSLSFKNLLLEKSSGSATPIINRTKWEDLIISLPPLKEQLRIITKVDDLFSICDKLKERIKKSQELKSILSKTIIEKSF